MGTGSIPVGNGYKLQTEVKLSKEAIVEKNKINKIIMTTKLSMAITVIVGYLLAVPLTRDDKHIG